MGEVGKDGKRRHLNHLPHPLLTSSFVIRIYFMIQTGTSLPPSAPIVPVPPPFPSMGGPTLGHWLHTFFFFFYINHSVVYVPLCLIALLSLISPKAPGNFETKVIIGKLK